MAHFKISNSRGFTLIEAIVALAIIGITLIPIMAFITNASRQLAVAADSTQRAFAQQATLGYIETINPLATPMGEADLTRALQIRWTSQEVVRSIARALMKLLPHARMEGLAGANHGMLDTHPEAVARLIAT